jgi:hypothetical protein
VFNVEDILLIEDKFGREAVEGNRKKPDGTELRWKQIGVKDISLMSELPFFVQWQTKNHPSEDGAAETRIKKLCIASNDKLKKSFFEKEILNSLTNIDIEWINPSQIDSFIGINSVDFETRNGLICVE